MRILQEKVNWLGYELQTKKVDSEYAVNKMNESLEVIKKIKGYIKEPADILNKARLFDKNLAEHPVSAAKEILVLVDFNQKMEELLDNIRSLFHRLELNQELPLDEVPSISVNTKEIHLLGCQETANVGQSPMPPKSDQPNEHVEEIVHE